MKKLSNNAKNFDFLELAEGELGISARHLQSAEKEGQYTSFQLFIHLVTMLYISIDQYIHSGCTAGETTLRRQLAG